MTRENDLTFIKCDTLNCMRPGIAQSESGGRYCWRCAIRLAERFGVNAVRIITPIPPWDQGEEFDCPHCGIRLCQGLVEIGNHCPSCKLSLEDKNESAVS